MCWILARMMALALARVQLPYQPEEAISQVERKEAEDGDRICARRGSVMSHIIHILPSRARGGWLVKRCEVSGTEVSPRTLEKRGNVRRRPEIAVVVAEGSWESGSDG